MGLRRHPTYFFVLFVSCGSFLVLKTASLTLIAAIMTKPSKASFIAGWALSLLLAAFLCGLSAGGKFTDWPEKAEFMGKFGYSDEVMWWIGVVEVAVTILFLIPQTAFIGAVLLTAYLGGATATHVRIEDPFYMPIVIGVLVWVALGLRRPDVFRLAFGCDKCVSEPNPSEANAV